jgi:hypothetical protein
LATAIAACIVSVAPLDAADLREGRLGEVVLEGTITSGDYDKLLSFVDARWNAIGSIYLASPGGSVTEAIKIGRLVRTLKLEAIAPAHTSSAGRKYWVREHKLTNPDANFMCASACFLVYVAGVKRDTDAPNSYYSLGDGAVKDYVEGLKWLTLAVSRSKDSIIRDSREGDRESFTSKMTAAQIAEAERRASEWQPTPEHDNRDRPSILKPAWWQFWR